MRAPIIYSFCAWKPRITNVWSIQESEGETGGIMKGIQSLHNWMSAQAKINPKLVNKKNINLEEEEEQSLEVR